MIEDKIKVIDATKINPVDYFNEHHAQYIMNLFINKPLGHFTSVNSFSYTDVKNLKKSKMIVLNENGTFMAMMENSLNMPVGELYTPYRMLCEFEFGGNWLRAAYHILHDIMNNEVNYIRVSTKFFKVITKVDRNKIKRTELKVWDKMTIVDDFGKKFLDKIPMYDDFTIEPDNKAFNQIRGNNYNLYSPMEYIPTKSFEPDDIKWSMNLLKHIFGEQVELGLIYMKVLYDLPTQKLPILVLTSEERSTGKTTFLDFLELIFGANAVVINPQDISNSFNGAYASSNIIMIEESRFDSVQATEKLKNLATQKKIMVNTKFVQQYSIPFHGKLIITSNDENKFSRVDDSEIRYWVRKVPSLTGKANHNILNDLRNEIPYFLCMLNSLDAIDTTKSRMVFEADSLYTEALNTVKQASRPGLHKELELLFDSHCAENTQVKEFKFIAKDIKTKWFSHNSKIEINYINNILDKSMKLDRDNMQRYIPLEETYNPGHKRSGKPFKLQNPYYEPDLGIEHC